MKHKLLFSFLFPGLFKFSMAEETAVIVVPGAETETPAEVVVEEKAVSEQAAEIVETAEHLAETIAKPNERHAELLTLVLTLSTAVASLREEVAMLREENNRRHDAIESRLDEILDFEEEEIENEEPPESIAVIGVETPEVIPPEEASTPQKRSRRWL